jgi:acyl-CoA synthetase (NDP forming)
MIASATPAQYGQALRILLDDESYDSVIVIFIPPLVTRAEEVARAIHDTAKEFREAGGEKTVLACFMSTRGAPPELSCGRTGAGPGDGECTIPAYVFPESAALALASASARGEWLARPVGKVPALEVDEARGRGIIEDAVAHAGAGGDVWLPADRCRELLEAYGIRSARVALAATAEEAVERAEEIGLPVAVKLRSATIAHKSDIGGVVLDVRSENEVRRAFEEIRARVEALGRSDEMQGVIVQEMAREGIEAIVGVTQDPQFGPLMMFGLGGTTVELLKDVSFRIHPLTDVDAREMVRSIKTYPLLEGWRGSPPGDVGALEELLLRVSTLVEDVPEIAEMDLNPVKVLRPGEGCVVVDTRVLVRRR